MVSNIPMNYGNLGYSNSALNDDFMYNAYMNQNSTQTAQQAAQGQVNFQGNPQQQPANKGSGLGALLLGGAAGAGAGYYFANPLKDSKQFKDSFVKTISKNADKANKYVKYFDTETKKFTKEAPTLFNKALKNFKWKQAGKWGAITVGSLFAANWLFGKLKGSQKQA